MLALGKYVPSEGIPGWTLAFIGFAITLFLLGNRRYPPALFVIALGVLYAAAFRLDFSSLATGIGFAYPRVWNPQVLDIWQGFLVLALPQFALSISNSVVATQKTVQDLFPETPVSVRKIGLTYSLMNLVAPWFSGVPCCHGAGGLAGHYTFGARTGGSVVIYGSIYLVIGLFFSGSFNEILKIFPLPILGVVLLFEGLTLMSFIKKIADSKTSLFVAFLVAMMAVGLPYGYLIGMVTGTLIVYLLNRKAVSVS
jgi:MFS superfamily sulfate permease-like transporter